MNDFSDKTKLLAVMVNTDNAPNILEVMKKAGIRGCTKVFGKVYGEDEERESGGSRCILLSIINSDYYRVINAILNETAKDNTLKVMAYLFDVSDFDVEKVSCPRCVDIDETSIRSVKMEQKKNLIVTVVNRCNTDDLMSAARQAGAQGGTVIGARGTGTEEDSMFFGVRLSPEKDMLLILADAPDSPKIIEAIKNQPIFNECCNGIVFTLAVDEAFSFNNSRNN